MTLFLLAVRLGAACENVDLAAARAAARARMPTDVPGAVIALDQAWEKLPGSCDPVDPAAIGEFALWASLVARRGADTAAVDRWLLTAGSLAEPPVCSEGLGDCGTYTPLPATDLVQAEQELWVDGVKLTVGEQRALVPGRHLIQIPGAPGDWFTTEAGAVLGLPSLNLVPTAPPPDPPMERHLGRALVLTGAGATMVALGDLAVYQAGYGSVWFAECAPGDPVRGLAPLPGTWAGLAECSERTGDPVLRNWVLSVALTSVGVGVSAAGLTWLGAELVSPRLTVTPAGVQVSGKF